MYGAHGLLGVDLDGNCRCVAGMSLRINAILYTNDQWKAGWVGELGIYWEDGEVRLKHISPLFNRLSIFEKHEQALMVLLIFWLSALTNVAALRFSNIAQRILGPLVKLL